MNETILEGSALINISKVDKISKEMGVFYNPVMKLNRDISILLLNTISKDKMQIALPLAGSGVRGIRFFKELNVNKIKSISFNDHSSKAVNSIKKNLKLNNIKKFTTIKKNNTNHIDRIIRIHNEDGNLFLLNSKGFDYIDVDPFGSSNFMLDSAVKRISREGVLAVTNTDTAALTGTYPKTCVRKYWSNAKKNYLMHETGLRILIRKIQLVGMQYDKALFPIFSYFKDHYFRIFFRCEKGKRLCDEVALEHGMFNDSGPLWSGKLWEDKLVNKMYSSILKNKENKIQLRIIKNKPMKYKIINNDEDVLRFLKIVKDESKIDALGFHDIHYLVKKSKLKVMKKKEELIKEIKELGFKAACSHFSGTGIRADISQDRLLRILKE
mgnify:CR=1 FL=1